MIQPLINHITMQTQDWQKITAEAIDKSNPMQTRLPENRSSAIDKPTVFPCKTQRQNPESIHNPPTWTDTKSTFYKLGGPRRRHHHKELPAAATLLLIRAGMYFARESQKEKGDSCKMMIQLLIKNI
jgi:hypothetical protein